jgi:hypothetical protein
MQRKKETEWGDAEVPEVQTLWFHIKRLQVIRDAIYVPLEETNRRSAVKRPAGAS